MDRCVPDTIIEPAVSVDLLLVGADVLLDRLDCDTFGLTTSDAEHRLAFTGPNLLSLEQRSGLLAALLRQLPHPLALLLWLAAALALGTQGVTLGLAIICVIGLNAGFALVQERHAEHAVAALALYLPPHASVVRDQHRRLPRSVSLSFQRGPGLGCPQKRLGSGGAVTSGLCSRLIWDLRPCWGA